MPHVQHLYLFSRPTDEEDQQLRALLSETLSAAPKVSSTDTPQGRLYSYPTERSVSETELRRELLTHLIPWGRATHSAFYLPSTSATAEITHVAFDLDGTLTTTELLPELARLSGRSEEMTALTEAAMAGATPFRESFMHRTELLRGLSREALHSIIHSITLPTDTTLLLRELSLPTAIVTGAYQPFVEDICERVGLSTFVGSAVRYTADGDFDGLDPEAIIDAEGKRAFLEEWTAGRSPRHSIRAMVPMTSTLSPP